MAAVAIDYERIIPRRIAGMPPSGIRKFFDLLDGMTDVTALTVGQPDFVTPWHIREAGIESLEKGKTYYTSNAGTMELRQEICAYLARRFSLQYDPAHETVVTVGGSEAIDIAMRALLEPGDEVIVPTPSFVCYGPLASMAGGVPIYLELKEENQFRLTAQELRSAITPRTKALVLPFPSNPTGGVLSRASLEAIAAIAREHDLLVLTQSMTIKWLEKKVIDLQTRINALETVGNTDTVTMMQVRQLVGSAA